MSPAQLIPILGANPLDWALAFAAPLLAILYIWPRFAKLSRYSDWIFLVFGLAIITSYIGYNVLYLFTPEYMSGIETQVVDVSWYFMEGHPLYHGPNAPEMYSMLYGPYLYGITGIFEKVLGPSSFSAKLPGQLALVLAIPLLFIILRKRLPVSLAAFGTSLLAVAHLVLGEGSVTPRPDTMLALAVIIGAWAVFSPLGVAPLVFGAAVGVAVNLKFHAVVYFLPLLYFAHQSGRRWGSAVTAAFTAFIIAVLPFLLLPNVSLSNYLWILKVAAQHGLDPNYYVSVTSDFFMLCVPLALGCTIAYFQEPSLVAAALAKHRVLIVLILAEFILLVLPASKYGAGPHHLLPMVIPLLLLWGELYGEGLRGGGMCQRSRQHSWLPGYSAHSLWGLGGAISLVN